MTECGLNPGHQDQSRCWPDGQLSRLPTSLLGVEKEEQSNKWSRLAPSVVCRGISSTSDLDLSNTTAQVKVWPSTPPWSTLSHQHSVLLLSQPLLPLSPLSLLLLIKLILNLSVFFYLFHYGSRKFTITCVTHIVYFFGWHCFGKYGSLGCSKCQPL